MPPHLSSTHPLFCSSCLLRLACVICTTFVSISWYWSPLIGLECSSLSLLAEACFTRGFSCGVAVAFSCCASNWPWTGSCSTSLSATWCMVNFLYLSLILFGNLDGYLLRPFDGLHFSSPITILDNNFDVASLMTSLSNPGSMDNRPSYLIDLEVSLSSSRPIFFMF